MPPQWQTGRVGGGAVQPSRVAVHGQRPEGGWNGSESLSVFRFTGVVPDDLLPQHADCALRDLGADSIATYRLTVPQVAGVAAVRSSGYFTIGGRRLWAQYSTYVKGDYTRDQGLLIQQVLFIESACRAHLRDDIAELSDAVQHAFRGLVVTVDTRNTSLQPMEVQHDGP